MGAAPPPGVRLNQGFLRVAARKRPPGARPEPAGQRLRRMIQFAWKDDGYVGGMAESSFLPSRRRGLAGTDLDGGRVELTVAVAKKLYRCPGCRAYIDVGTEHVLIRSVGEEEAWHQHWHRACASEFARRDLRSLHVVDTIGRGPTKGQRRRAALRRRRRT